jgi:hypothetical protein
MAEMTFLLVEDSEADALIVKMEMNWYPGVRLVWVHDGQDVIDYLLGKQPFDDRVQY